MDAQQLNDLQADAKRMRWLAARVAEGRSFNAYAPKRLAPNVALIEHDDSGLNIAEYVAPTLAAAIDAAMAAEGTT